MEPQCNRAKPEKKHQQQWLMVETLLCTAESARERRGKDHFFWKRTSSGKESRASCQGTTLHFLDMRRRQERGGEGNSAVRASAGPPGTPLPGGRKSMWFLSYLWQCLSTASNIDIQWAAKRRKKADTEDENASTPLPLPSHLFIEPAPVRLCAHVSIHKPMHTPLSAIVTMGRCSPIDAAR